MGPGPIVSRYATSRWSTPRKFDHRHRLVDAAGAAQPILPLGQLHPEAVQLTGRTGGRGTSGAAPAAAPGPGAVEQREVVETARTPESALWTFSSPGPGRPRPTTRRARGRQDAGASSTTRSEHPSIARSDGDDVARVVRRAGPAVTAMAPRGPRGHHGTRNGRVAVSSSREECLAEQSTAGPSGSPRPAGGEEQPQHLTGRNQRVMRSRATRSDRAGVAMPQGRAITIVRRNHGSSSSQTETSNVYRLCRPGLRAEPYVRPIHRSWVVTRRARNIPRGVPVEPEVT